MRTIGRGVCIFGLLCLCACRHKPAPEHYFAKFETSKGEFVIEVTRSLAPERADRFYDLVNTGFYDTTRFYCVSSESARFGISGDPATNKKWESRALPFEPVKSPHDYGAVSFDDPFTTAIFVEGRIEDHLRDATGAATFGRVVSGMATLRQLSTADGCKPDPKKIAEKGDVYLEEFPRLDYVRSGRIDRNHVAPPPAALPSVMLVTLEEGKLLERWEDPVTREARSRMLVESGVAEATVSPAGRYITYTRLKDSGPEVVLRSLADGQEQTITDSATCSGCETAVVWAQDENHFSYLSHRVLYVYSMANHKVSTVYSPPCASAAGYVGCESARLVNWFAPDKLRFRVNSAEGTFLFEARLEGGGVHLYRAPVAPEESKRDDPTKIEYITIPAGADQNVVATWSARNLMVIDLETGSRVSLGETAAPSPKVLGWIPRTGR